MTNQIMVERVASIVLIYCIWLQSIQDLICIRLYWKMVLATKYEESYKTFFESFEKKNH